MIEAEWWDYEDGDELAEAVAGDVAFIIESAIDARGSAVIALAGGSTPKPILEKLADAKLDWKRVTIIPTDERVVAMTDPLSNVAMLARIFLPKGARVIPLVSEKAADYKAAGAAASSRLTDFHWPLDLVWLGVGKDGHTASIFPGPDYDDALNAPAERRMVGVMPDPLPQDAPVARITLTRAAIQSAKTILIVITGEDKKVAVERAIKDGDSSPLPIGRVLAGLETPVDIHWAA
ncbi:MAG: 6-phosphogluconolactonase [Sphingomonadales bacterium]|jgi:6-phosphogluconolactonase|nr:6-phosphogluconolactonase [Sphingomonadales bacterium]